MKLKSNIAACLIILFLVFQSAIAQQFTTPRPSPNASVTQTIGITEVTIDYSSPGVKGRKIWGDLVPFGKVWRTGANEVTSITFSDPVKINGNILSEGTYGIHTIPGESEWYIIFSGDTKVNDPSTFNEKKEKLRIKVTPQVHEFTERLIFTFSDVTENSGIVNLIWEKVKVSFKVETDTKELTLEKARKLVDWNTPMQAAQYCLNNNINLSEAVKWIEASVLLNENYWNMRIRARLLEKIGRKDEAVSSLERAITLGNALKDKPFDFEQMQKLLIDWKK